MSYHKNIRKFHKSRNRNCSNCKKSLKKSKHHFYCNECWNKKNNVLYILNDRLL